MSVHVLLVCTANLCRSPIAEHLMRRASQQASLNWSTSSAGTHAESGRDMHPSARRVLEDRDIDPGEWTTHGLTAELIDAADLVLTASTAHRHDVVTLAPAALRRTFTIMQFARLTRSLPRASRESSTGLVDGAIRARTSLSSVNPEDDDLADPFGHSYPRFEACADLVDRASAEILGLVAEPTEFRR